MIPASVHDFVESTFIPAQLVTAMLGMGATLSARDFHSVLRESRGLAVGLVLQLVFVPLWAFLFAHFCGLSRGWAVGLILVSVVPGGAFSNLLTFFARGTVALSIALTVACTSLCVITVPLLLRLLTAADLPPDFELPIGRIVFEIFFYLLIPLLAGMLIYRFAESWSKAVSRWSIRASMLLLVLITVSALGSGRIRVAEYGWGPPLLILAFGVTLAVLTPHLSRLAGRFDDDSVAIGIEVTVRNIGVGLLLIHFFFPGSEAQGHVLYTCLFYAGISGPIAIPMVLAHRYSGRVVLLRRRRRRPALSS